MDATWRKMVDDLALSIQTAQLLLQQLTSMAQEVKSMELKIKQEKAKTIDWEKVKQEVHALRFGLEAMKEDIARQLTSKGFFVKWKLSEEVHDYFLSCHIQDEDGFPIKLRMADDYVKDMIAYAQNESPDKKCFCATFECNPTSEKPNVMLWFRIIE